jgi:MacB-like periplasmic core domain
VGKSVKVSGQQYTVIGVMPRGFAFRYGVTHPMVWTPIVLGSGDMVRQKQQTPNYATIGRLATGASVTTADAELKTIQAAAAT